VKSQRRARRLVLATCALGIALLAACGKRPAKQEVTIAAAMSLRGVMPELVRAYGASHTTGAISVMYGASGDLETQVVAGAPVDAVVLAGARQVDELIAKGRATNETRAVVATNDLCLVGRRDGPPLTFATLGTLAPGERLAVGDPRTVPAGEYARDYLRSLGSWDALAGRLLLGSSVAAVLVYARRGEAAFAVVYRTELHDVSDLVILDDAHGPGAPRPEVVAAAVRGGQSAAVDFVAFLASPTAVPLWKTFGFGPP
jgi:molybdate transport system substrate-binding protein